MAVSMSDADLRSLIGKESTKRLKAEFLVAQKHFDAAEIDVMNRRYVMSHIYALRRLAGQTSVLKSVVPNYDATKVQIFPEDLDPGLLTPTATSSLDINSLMFSMVQLMNDREDKRREDERAARVEERKDAETKENNRRKDEETKENNRRAEDRKDRETEREFEKEKRKEDKDERSQEFKDILKDNKDREDRMLAAQKKKDDDKETK